MQLLGGEQRETPGQVEAHLVAEDGKGAGTRPVLLFDALVEDPAHELEIGLHRVAIWRVKAARPTRNQGLQAGIALGSGRGPRASNWAK